jgi:endoglycosylceramidase
MPALLVSLLLSCSLAGQAAEFSPVLRTEGRHFKDAQGRVVILRGVNLSGDAKVPPFLPCTSTADLDRIANLGFNVIRLVFVWEAYEPVEGVYNDACIAQLQDIAREAWARGIHVIIDIHQDGFSRHASRGAGDGFPRWAVSPRGQAATPDNSDRCRHWVAMMATDRTAHRSFDDFYANAHGVRTRYLQMLIKISGAFAQTPGVIGYDLLNEPWGDERRELAPLYRDAAEIVLAQHPGAILFLEGHITTNCGIATRLPRPSCGSVAYAPHYYRPLTVTLGRWHGMTVGMNRAFASMCGTSQEWDAPLFIGEFGAAADTRNAGEYVAAIYDRMDEVLASGAQWAYSPRWNERDKDGWNGEDFSILDSSGVIRPNFRPRPYPRSTAGTPLAFRYADGSSTNGQPSLVFTWQHRPELGTTEVFLPRSVFAADSLIEISEPTLICQRDESRQLLVCRCDRPATVSIRVSAPRGHQASGQAWGHPVQPMQYN